MKDANSHVQIEVVELRVILMHFSEGSSGALKEMETQEILSIF